MTSRDKSLLREKWERQAERPLIILALVFLGVLIFPALRTLSPAEKTVLDLMDWAIWAIFIIDYLVRIFLAKHQWKYIRTHPIQFLIVAIPFFQPLRLLRLLPLSAYFISQTRGKFENRIFTFVAFAAVSVGIPACIAMFEVEHKAKGATIRSLGESLWWLFSTLTTVGYGDRYPVTTIGRVIAVFVMVTGISLVGLLTAAVASIFIGSREDVSKREKSNLKIILDRLDSLEIKIEESEARIWSGTPQHESKKQSSTKPKREGDRGTDRNIR
jgi:voltage-gated potassium channel